MPEAAEQKNQTISRAFGFTAGVLRILLLL
jgi:hypothetical protein